MKIPTALAVSLFLISLLSACNPFSNRALNNNYLHLSANNKVLVDNSYEINSFRIFDNDGPVSEERNEGLHSNIIEILNDDGQVFEQELSYKHSKMNLKFIDHNTLSISITENSDELYHEEVKGRFKKDGFFHLDQTFSSSLGIPYIVGGRYKYQTRLGLTNHGSLILQSIEVNQGALLLLFWKGYVRHKVYHFRKIQMDSRA